jgi:hypothetical protein
VLVGLCGCRAHAPAPPRPDLRPPPPLIDLPPTTPNLPSLDGKGLPPALHRATTNIEGQSFHRLTESDCLLLAAANAAGAGLLEEELPPPAGKKSKVTCEAAGEALRRSIQSHTAHELRNRAAALALERFHQLAEVEAGADLVRQSSAIIDPLLAKAREARARNVRYPLDPDDLERQYSQLLTQLEGLVLASRLINLDLKRRIGLPYEPAGKRLWPAGDFAIDPTPADPEQAATAALADRPELRGLRELHAGLSPETLPDVRELLGAASAAAGRPRFALLIAHVRLHGGPDPAVLAELEVRRKQLADLIATRERQIADEARAAALTLDSQRVRATLARDRLRSWDEKLVDAVRKREANQPGAELLEAQVRMERLKAKAELNAEVAAWHRARVKLRTAMGWLAWEAVGASTPR